MIHYSFSKYVYGRSKKFSKLYNVGIFRLWMNVKKYGNIGGQKNWREVPCFVCWEIWKHKNSILFEGQSKSVWKVISKAASSYGEFHNEKVSNQVRNPRSPILNNTMPFGFFDGASQEAGMKCGARAVLKLNESRSFHLKMGCGRVTNTRG